MQKWEEDKIRKRINKGIRRLENWLQNKKGAIKDQESYTREVERIRKLQDLLFYEEKKGTFKETC